MTRDADHSYGWTSEHESDLNRLKGVQTNWLRISPESADISFQVNAERIVSGTEVRGRIVGPRCLFRETAETVSPVRSVVDKSKAQVTLIARTAFPKPRFWDPRSPLLYRVVLELWQDGHRCDVAAFDLGFRTTEFASDILRVNGEPLVLRGMTRLPESREEAGEMRLAGYNLVLAPKGESNWWVRANPMGFLLLEQESISRIYPHYYINIVGPQSCFLGLVVNHQEMLERSTSDNDDCLRLLQESGVHVGLRLDEMPRAPLPSSLSFLLCPALLAPALSTIDLPKLVLLRPEELREKQALAALPGVLGWVEQ